MRRDDIIRAAPFGRQSGANRCVSRVDAGIAGSDAIRAAGGARTSKEDGMEPKTGYD